MPNVVAAILKNRECWTRFLSLHGELACLAPSEGEGNGPSRVLLCRSVAEPDGAHSLFRCVPIIPKRPLATRIGYVHLQFFPTPLKRRRPYTGATQHGCLSNSVTPSPHKGAVPDAALLLLFRSQFVCGHAFLTSRRKDCQAADFAVGTGKVAVTSAAKETTVRRMVDMIKKRTRTERKPPHGHV